MTYLMVVRVPADANPTREEGDPSAWVEASEGQRSFGDRLRPPQDATCVRVRESEAHALVALMLLHDSRRVARVAPDGPYLLQASIAACHATAPTPEATPWARVVELYDALVQLSPFQAPRGDDPRRAGRCGVARGRWPTARSRIRRPAAGAALTRSARG